MLIQRVENYNPKLKNSFWV